MSDTKKELEEMCKDIAESLESFAEGKLYDLDECKFVDRSRVEDKNGCYDDSRYQDLYAYLNEDNYGIKITTSLDGEDYFGADICVAWGGPNIYIETRDSYVRGYWGSDRAEAPLSYSARDKIDDIIDEWRQCY